MSASFSTSTPVMAPWRQRTAMLVLLTLVLGLVGATGVTPSRPAAAAVSATLVSHLEIHLVTAPNFDLKET